MIERAVANPFSAEVLQLLEQLSKLPDKEQSALTEIMLLLPEVPREAELRACEMLRSVIEECRDKDHALTRMNEVIAFLSKRG